MLAPETPDESAGGAIDFVDGVCVTGRDEIGPLGILVNRVDVEIVPSVGAVIARAGLTWVQGQVCL